MHHRQKVFAGPTNSMADGQRQEILQDSQGGYKRCSAEVSDLVLALDIIFRYIGRKPVAGLLEYTVLYNLDDTLIERI